MNERDWCETRTVCRGELGTWTVLRLGRVGCVDKEIGAKLLFEEVRAEGCASGFSRVRRFRGAMWRTQGSGQLQNALLEGTVTVDNGSSALVPLAALEEVSIL